MYDDNDPHWHVVARGGVLYFNGHTAEQRLSMFDAPREITISSAGRKACGVEQRGHREGTWRYSIGDEEQFVVHFDNDRAVEPPAAWIEAEWPKPDTRSEERALLELVLREYRTPEDIERIYRLITARGHNSIPVVRALYQALGIGLSEAKMALDRACTRAKRG